MFNEKGFGPKGFVNSCIIAYKPVAYKRNKSIPKNDSLGDGFDSRGILANLKSIKKCLQKHLWKGRELKKGFGKVSKY